MPALTLKETMEEHPKKSEKPAASEKHSKADPVKSSFQKILTYIQTTDLEYVQIEKNGTKASFRREGVVPNAAAAEALEVRNGKKEEAEEPKYFSIRSPIVGRFHSSMGADRPPLVVEGGRVTAGQKVA